jgi:uncharacterized membrane protein YcaP (DUF421 family)
VNAPSCPARLVVLLSTVAPISAADVGVYAVRTLIVVVFLFVGFRIFGKREMAQLNVYDLAMLMALANAVQNAMTGGRGNLAVGLATSTTVLLGAFVLTKIVQRRPTLEHRLVGWPTVIVNGGVMLHRQMRRERVTADEVAEAVRGHGLADVSEVRLAVLEVDGSISIVPAVADGPKAQNGPS